MLGAILGCYIRQTNQHCRAEDSLASDMEWFATGVHW